MSNKLLFIGYFLMLSMFLGCASMFAIPRIKLAYWSNLKPVNVIIKRQTECYSAKVVFTKGGHTVFNNLTPLSECDNSDGISINLTQEEFDNNLQWNFFYLAERIKDCR